MPRLHVILLIATIACVLPRASAAQETDRPSGGVGVNAGVLGLGTAYDEKKADILGLSIAGRSCWKYWLCLRAGGGISFGGDKTGWTVGILPEVTTRWAAVAVGIGGNSGLLSLSATQVQLPKPLLARIRLGLRELHAFVRYGGGDGVWWNPHEWVAVGIGSEGEGEKRPWAGSLSVAPLSGFTALDLVPAAQPLYAPTYVRYAASGIGLSAQLNWNETRGWGGYVFVPLDASHGYAPAGVLVGFAWHVGSNPPKTADIAPAEEAAP